jgi:hypothetical protein
MIKTLLILAHFVGVCLGVGVKRNIQKYLMNFIEILVYRSC